MKKTKIVCTIGPASNKEAIIEQMLNAGMNVARYNMSHGDHKSHKRDIDMFRRVRDRMGIPAAVMLDSKGPEIRLKNFENGFALINPGDEFTFTVDDILGNSSSASITYADLPRQLKAGDRILIDDGKNGFEVLSTDEKNIYCKVLFGEKLQNHKSINVPNIKLDMPFISDADKSDFLFAIKMNVDFIAASFTRRKEDVIELRKFLDYNGGHDIKIIAKIENTEGIENFDEILAHSDGIMVARGDMGVEIPFEKIPGIQKEFIRKCYQSGKMAITATQMLESMTSKPTPTRAEITDVANAVFDGTSAVMLSGESASGNYPIESVKVMARIVEQAESDALELGLYSKFIKYDNDFSDFTNAICDAACKAARDVDAKAIIAITASGRTARGMSKFRPNIPIIAPTPKVKTYHQLALSWGVYPVIAKYKKTIKDLFVHAIDCAKNIDAVNIGDKVVITAGLPVNELKGTNVVRIETVGPDITIS